ncbi:MAG: substrate-binding domain-containing protein [Synergistaceae bacterium]|nr:substrate-binding domain-containing protein [Synergistaceae bacterium]
MKKFLSVFLCGLMVLSIMAAPVFSAEEVNTSGKEMDIRIISKSFNNQFYQAAFKGAADAAAKLGVKITTNGPDVETNTSQQVEQVKAAVNARPDAIVLAACDTASLEETLDSAKEAGIPVIGFDSGVPGDTTGAVLATAATDNGKAGGNVAANLIADPGFQKAILKGTEKAPTVLAILAQDATSGSIVLRVDGFIAQALASLEALEGLKGAVSVSGQEKWTKPSANPEKVKIVVVVPPSSSAADIQAASKTIFAMDNLVGVFAANQDAVNGVISATNDGTDLDRADGIYKDIFVVGFDSGTSQREAIKDGQFFGSVTQDPYQMGYQAVVLAVRAANKEPVSDIDTGSKWYNAKNIDNEDIAILLYD